MPAIDELLAQSLLLQEPHVPSDVIPYEDTAYPALAPDGAPLWVAHGRDVADDGAARSLYALCEAALVHCTADQLADFITDQLPQPRAAWILGCVLQLAEAEAGARFWWQYAAGAGDAAASYSLYLQHLAHGDPYAASFWQAQACSDLREGLTRTYPAENDDAPAYTLITADTSIPTVLRVLSRLTQAAPREHTETATAVIDFVAAAVAIGYDRHPGIEIPLPGPDFAEHLGIILAATAASWSTGEDTLSAESLPNRPPLQATAEPGPPEEHSPEPDRLLVEVTSSDGEPVSAFFKAAVAVCWEAATADRAESRADEAGTRLRYYLDRRRITDCRHRAFRPRAAQPSR
ncbi:MULTISPECIES: DUF6207 family protein [Streptomyces]|uniref:DUF6207 family protein n=2 Tax=Streptomyces TaxID=1883 RepID=A0ABV9J837_9ACTN